MNDFTHIVDTTKIFEIVLTQSSGNAGLKWRLGAKTRIPEIGIAVISSIFHDESAHLLQNLQQIVVEAELESGHTVRLKAYQSKDVNITYDVLSQITEESY